MARIFGECIILISLSMLIGLGVNYFSPVGIPLFGNWDPSKGSVNAGGRCQPVTDEVADSAVADFYIDPETVFVDARSVEDYQEGHIPRAISFPIGDFQNRISDFLVQVPLSSKLVVYCSGVECHDSHELAELLMHYGFKEIRVYAQGYDGWIALNRPVERGETNE